MKFTSLLLTALIALAVEAAPANLVCSLQQDSNFESVLRILLSRVAWLQMLMSKDTQMAPTRIGSGMWRCEDLPQVVFSLPQPHSRQ